MEKTGTGNRRAAAKLRAARTALLIAVVFTALNIALFLFGGATYLLFSLNLPYFAVVLGALYGMIPAGALVAALLLVIFILLYLLCDKHVGFLIAVTALVAVDTTLLAVVCLASHDLRGVLDGIIHVWMLYMLIAAVRAYDRPDGASAWPENY